MSAQGAAQAVTFLLTTTQPREHPVPCLCCGRRGVWTNNPRCDRCQDHIHA